VKAFLSHSSNDKEFVTKVASELGRQFCAFDTYAFATGVEFRKSIEEGLDISAVFVLFASKSSLGSLWVDFEIDEAWFRRIQRAMPSSLVYIIDSSVSISDVPEWLRRARFRHQISPKVIAREVRSQIEELLRERQSPVFVGRVAEMEELEQAMIPLNGSPPPRVLAVFGLLGIGRRALIRRISPGLLNISRNLQVRIQDGDSANDLCAIVADLTEPYSTRKGLDRILADIRDLTPDRAIKRTLVNLRNAISSGELPILIDEGGILDSEGFIMEPTKSLLSAVAPNDELYVFMVLRRRPQGNPESLPPIVRVDELSQRETSRLLAVLANRSELQLSHAQISELTEYVHGYPPAAHFAIQQALEYGIDLVIKDKHILREFQTSVFLRYLSKVALSPTEEKLLRLLAFYSPLPFGTIAVVVDLEFEDLGILLVRLIDHALVVVDGRGLYRIADPVTYATNRAFGLPNNDEHTAVAAALAEFLEREELGIPQLQLSRVFFRAARLSGDLDAASKANHLASDLIALAESLYHSRGYLEAIAVGYSAVEERPSSESARSYLVRALIQEERWVEAESQLRELEHHAPRRNVLFLQGFLHRNRGETQAAIKAYSEAADLGRKGAAISRELAQCYLLERDLDNASRYIRRALSRHGDNPYVLDIQAKVATLQNDESEARKALSQLELIDKSFYYHRKSTVDLSFGKPLEAEAASEQAVQVEASPPFHIYAQLCNCKITNGKLNEALRLANMLDKKYAKTHVDVRLGLRARLSTAKGHYAEALRLTEKMRKRDSISFKIARADAIKGELKASVLKDSDRESLAKELAVLKHQLQGRQTFEISEID